MTHKGIAYLRMFDAVSIIRHADKLDTALFNFHRNGMRSGVHRIFHQLLYDACRTLHNLSCGYFINCRIIKYMNFCHI